MTGGVIPYLCCADAKAAIEFYVAVFGATRDEVWTETDGRVGHAELTVSGQVFYLADEHPEIGVRGPRSLGGTSVSLLVDVPDVDATVAKAVGFGATLDRPVADQPYGLRSGWIIDPFGHRWGVRTRLGPVTPDVVRERVGDRYSIEHGGAAP